MLPHIRLHPHAVKRMLAQKCQPDLHRLWVAVLDLHQPSQRDALKILLALLVHEVRPRHRPALDDLGERGRSGGGQLEVVGGAHGEVGHELDVTDRVGAQLQVAGRHAVLGPPAERCQVGGCDIARWTGEAVGFGFLS